MSKYKFLFLGMGVQASVVSILLAEKIIEITATQQFLAGVVFFLAAVVVAIAENARESWEDARKPRERARKQQ